MYEVLSMTWAPTVNVATVLSQLSRDQDSAHGLGAICASCNETPRGNGMWQYVDNADL